jgi:outer membrane immunogenic protein
VRKALMLAGSALIAFVPASRMSAQSLGGPYAGIHAGGQQTGVRNVGTKVRTQALDADRQSFTGGLFMGYDRQVAPRIVLGAEAGVDVASDDAVRASTSGGPVVLDPRWSLDLTARAGYLLDPATLAYVRGGYTNAPIETGANSVLSQLSQSEYRDS